MSKPTTMRWDGAKMTASLEDLLEMVSVHVPFQWENDDGPKGWYAVSVDEAGIIAYFATEKAAYQYRLSLINERLNAGWEELPESQRPGYPNE